MPHFNARQHGSRRPGNGQPEHGDAHEEELQGGLAAAGEKGGR